MKIDKVDAAKTISMALDCLDNKTKLKLYDALLNYLIAGKKLSANLDWKERGMLTLMINLVDNAIEVPEEMGEKTEVEE